MFAGINSPKKNSPGNPYPPFAQHGGGSNFKANTPTNRLAQILLSPFPKRQKRSRGARMFKKNYNARIIYIYIFVDIYIVDSWRQGSLFLSFSLSRSPLLRKRCAIKQRGKGSMEYNVVVLASVARRMWYSIMQRTSSSFCGSPRSISLSRGRNSPKHKGGITHGCRAFLFIPRIRPIALRL